MLNREQRRAQLKQLGKKFSGIDITKGTLDVPVKGSKEPLQVDLMNFDTIYHLSEMCDKFSNLREAYPEEYEAADAETDERKKTMMMVRLYKRVITDFTTHVEAIFGEGATTKIFGNTSPMPQAIAEFIEDMSPVATALGSFMSGEMSDNSGVDGEKPKSGGRKRATARTGNA